MTNQWPDALQMTVDAPSEFNNDAADLLTIVGRVMRPGIVNSVEFVPNWNLTGATTNNRTFTLVNKRTTGTGTTAIAQLSMTTAASITQAVAVSMSITTANANVAVGDVLRWESVHNGNGQQDPGGIVIVQQNLGS